MTLRQFLISKGAKQRTIYEGTERVKILYLLLNGGSQDRFGTAILFDAAFPTTVFVTKDLSRGLTIVPHEEILYNHNQLHTTAKEAYEKLLIELTNLDIKYELNGARYLL